MTMIVRLLPKATQLITQPDHARLAGQIMARSSGLRNHPRRESILLAISEHDNGWQEEDAAPSVDAESGAVVDFVRAPLALRHRVWPRGVARLAPDSWAAALVAHHAITVYDRFRADRAWDAFFAEMEAARARMLQATAGAFDDLAADYVHVRLGDLISLAFCSGWTDEQRFDPWTVRLHADIVRVTPDPFGGAIVPLHITAREVPGRFFESAGALSDALRTATHVDLVGTTGAV